MRRKDLNMASDEIQNRPKAQEIEEWIQMWKEGGHPAFHLPKVYSSLQSHIYDLTGGKAKWRVFVPLCGKSLDMIWLADQGHTVVGLEISQTGIKDFFKENNLDFTIAAINMAPSGAYIFKAKAKDITIFQCDIFDFRSDVAGGKFDSIWDRGSLTSMAFTGEATIKNYVEVVSKMLADNGRWMIETFDYDETTKREGSHAFISDKMIHRLFENKFVVRDLEKTKYAANEGFHQLETAYWVYLYLVMFKHS